MTTQNLQPPNSVVSLWRAARTFSAALAALLAFASGTAAASLPAGLDSRANIGAYLDGLLPTVGTGNMPALLSQTGVYTNLPARTPHAGLIPYAGNSALWTDNSLKSRYIGLPYDGTTNSPTIEFSAAGIWKFPAGTVFVKNFDLVTDERVGAANPVRRLETRILVRLADGGIRGASYKWRLDNSDAERVDEPLPFDPVPITQADSTTRNQEWAYPSPTQCLICHNIDAGLVLGMKTAQQNGNYTYPAPGRTDNQLHTFSHLGMFDQAIADPPTAYARMVDVLDASATMEDRVKSYQDANCGHCHRPSGTRPVAARGPLYDMRYESSILSPVTGRISIVANSGYDGLVRRDIANSSIHDRDGRAGVGSGQMPPLARNVPDQRILALYDQWVNYAFDVLNITRLTATSVRLKFDRAVETVSATTPTNYAISDGVTVSQAIQGADASEVILTTSNMVANTSYTVTINRVKEIPPPQNPIWPNTQIATMPPSAPGAPTISTSAAGYGQVSLSFMAPASDGGAQITSYTASCSANGQITRSASGAASPLTVNNLTAGVAYICSLTASNSFAFTSVSSGVVQLTPVRGNIAPLLMLLLD